MKRNRIVLILFLALIMIICACKKKKEESNNIPLPDNILFVDLSPDTSFTSVRGVTNGGMLSVPIPDDTTAGMKIDIDKDGVFDLGVTVSTYYAFVSASYPWGNYQFCSALFGGDENDCVAYQTGYCDNYAKSFEKDSVISNELLYMNYSRTYCNGRSLYGYCNVNSFSGDTYYGFRLARKGGYYYGWILLNHEYWNTLIVKEYGLNMTINNSIRAGQKE